MQNPTRRRFLAIAAASLVMPRTAVAASWRGVALGASVSITLAGVDTITARPVFAAIEVELDRLERVFSLFEPMSALSRLNRDGALVSVPKDLANLLALSDQVHVATQGAFDPTVQPLWQALAQGGSKTAARALIGWDNVLFDGTSVRFARPGMALTLNGVAQGYITDRITELLRAHGFGDVLVDMGEVRAVGHANDGRAWQAGVAFPAGQIVHQITLADRALATSAPGGTMLTPEGQGHILGPSGQAPLHELVSVSAPTAALADALSTAFCLMPEADAQAAAARFAETRIEVMI